MNVDFFVIKNDVIQRIDAPDRVVDEQIGGIDVETPAGFSRDKRSVNVGAVVVFASFVVPAQVGVNAVVSQRVLKDQVFEVDSGSVVFGAVAQNKVVDAETGNGTSQRGVMLVFEIVD